jgi:hypothetical protein
VLSEPVAKNVPPAGGMRRALRRMAGMKDDIVNLNESALTATEALKKLAERRDGWEDGE